MFTLAFVLFIATCFTHPKHYQPIQDYSDFKSVQHDTATIPTNWDWRTAKGIQLITSVKNQHVPVYCGSCWAHGSTSALADRLAIKYGGHYTNFMPSVQWVIDQKTAGTCQGGDAMPVYQLAKTKGIPSQTCNPYLAINDAYSGAKADCFTCQPDGSCGAIEPNLRLFVQDMGVVSGYDNIKAEVYNRGPIACALCATADFENYAGGIFKGAPSSADCLNHEIEIIGYGVEGTTEYLIGRNSWGANWGGSENGYFKISTAAGENLNVCSQNSGVWATGVELKYAQG